MYSEDDILVRRFDALNTWLGDVYGVETDLNSLLINMGLNSVDIDYIKQEHLGSFLQAVMELLDSYPDLRYGRNQIMIECYGLLDGNPKNPYAIAHNYGVCGQRITQLVHQRLNLYHDPQRQTQLQYDLAEIAWWLLQ